MIKLTMNKSDWILDDYLTSRVFSNLNQEIVYKISLVCRFFYFVYKTEALNKQRVTHLDKKLIQEFYIYFRSWHAVRYNWLLMSQYGTVISPTEVHYADRICKGNFKDGFLNGYGEAQYFEGYTKKGLFKNGAHIKGTVTFSKNQITLKGLFEDDYLKKGKAVYSNGLTFEGKFNKIGIKKGSISYHIYHAKAKGVFENNQLKYGTLIHRYNMNIGHFKEGNLYGFGSTVINGGEIIFRGLFKNGQLNGPGIHVTNHFKKEGYFKNYMLHGWGRVTYSDETVVEGIFENDELIKGCVVSSNKTIQLGYFFKSKLHGPGIIAYTDFSLTDRVKLNGSSSISYADVSSDPLIYLNKIIEGIFHHGKLLDFSPLLQID